MPRRVPCLAASLLMLGLCGTVPAQAPIVRVVFDPQEKLSAPPEKKAPDKTEPPKKEPTKTEPPKKEPIKKEPTKTEPDKQAPPLYVEEAKPAEPECKDDSVFAKMPPIARLPKPGNPLIVPPAVPEMGCGFYSLKDCICGEMLEAPPKYPYPRFSIIPYSFFDFDWRYLDKPDNKEQDCFDCLKRIHLLDDNFLFTTGGEIRLRYANENNSRLTGINNHYELIRTRVYGDLSYRDRFRFFAEFLDAQAFDGHLPPLVTDIDRTDFLNLFGEVRLFDIDCDGVWLRIGRQELTYGSQRLISPLDWANTRRTFQGVKAYWHSEHLDVDGFRVQPVVPDPGHFDSVDNNQVFSGLWATWKPCKKQSVDLYALNLDNTNVADLRKTMGVPVGPYNITTLGSRYYGEYESGLMADVEGAFQFGKRLDQTDTAGMGTAGVGYIAKCCPMTPQAWIYYDYATGDNSPTPGSEFHTFNQLFPFGHYYFGCTDVIGRQNIQDLNAQLGLYPTRWLTTMVQFHVVRLAESRDALYNSAGVPIRRDPTGLAGNDVGQIINFVTNVHLSKHSDVFLQYSHLFSGDFIKQTGTPDGRRDLDYVYLQFSYRW